eukprot:SAG31_NODE_1785_length_7278_cov_4.205321_12_plen_73_part_00
MLQVVSFSDGGEIMVQGDEGDAIYFLESGGAVAIKDSSEGTAEYLFRSFMLESIRKNEIERIYYIFALERMK